MTGIILGPLYLGVAVISAGAGAIVGSGTCYLAQKKVKTSPFPIFMVSVFGGFSVASYFRLANSPTMNVGDMKGLDKQLINGGLLCFSSAAFVTYLCTWLLIKKP